MNEKAKGASAKLYGSEEKRKVQTNLNVVRVKVTPSELHVAPPLVRGRAVENVLSVGEERRSRDVPLIGGEKQDVSGGRVHLVRLSRAAKKNRRNASGQSR
jgi:hypothetical protein